MKSSLPLFDSVPEGVVPGAQAPTRFDGPAYDPKQDKDRLATGLAAIFDLMKNQRWLTLDEISARTGVPAASASAQLRHLRKDRFGAHMVNKRRRANCSGIWEYQLIPNTKE